MSTEAAYNLAKERYAALGVDTDAVLKTIKNVSISMHCWQGDDVGGFETDGELSGGGIMATGNYPGKARSIAELQQDLEKAYSLLPGSHRLNLHAIYLDNGGSFVDRDQIEVKHFQGWIDWAKKIGIGMDFNPSCFSHEKSNGGFTLASEDKNIRDFWIEHCKRTRVIAAAIGEALGSPSINNVWIPDGYKDSPFDRVGPRKRLEESLNEIFKDEQNPAHMKDAVESKLFGIGSESYVVGSHEFYMGYAMKYNKVLCLDAGHFHPTETIIDKIPATLQFVDELLLHVSRGVRWDSDHVVTMDDHLRGIAESIVRHGFLNRVNIGLDFFDASINRIAAWVIGTRNTIKSVLYALLEPHQTLAAMESEGDFTGRLALMEELKAMPATAIWDYYCEQEGVPVGVDYMKEIRAYEGSVLNKRSSEPALQA